VWMSDDNQEGLQDIDKEGGISPRTKASSSPSPSPRHEEQDSPKFSPKPSSYADQVPTLLSEEHKYDLVPDNQEEHSVSPRTETEKPRSKYSLKDRTSHQESYQPKRERRYSDQEDVQERQSHGDYKYQKDSFEYDTYVDMVGEGASFATAAQLSALEKRQKVLIEAIDQLEDKLYDSETKRLAVQRQLLIAEEVSADYRTLIDQRESQNVLIRKDLDQLGVQFQNESSRFNEIDNERRKLEHKAALVQAEKDVNSRAKAKLEQYLAEIENLKHKLTSMLNEKGDLDKQVSQRQKEVSDLEKRLHSESLRSREINNRTVSNLENMIETERKRAQQAIDYVRQTLKAKIRVLEAQIEVDRTSDTNIKNEKRDIARQLKNVKRKLDEKKSEVGRDKRKIEALSKQVAALKERQRKLTMEISDLENEQHTLKRETTTLATQVEATQFSNAKLHVLVPTSVSASIEEEASAKFPKPEENKPADRKSQPPKQRRPSLKIESPRSPKSHQELDVDTKPMNTEEKFERKELDLDSLALDLDTQVDIDDNLDDLVRQSELDRDKTDPDQNIVIDDQ